MKEMNCPFIGLQEDQNTHVGFPFEGNECFIGEKSRHIDLDHQESYCLNQWYLLCSIYIEHSEGKPTEEQLPDRKNLSPNRLLIPIIILFVILGSIPLILNSEAIMKGLSTMINDYANDSVKSGEEELSNRNSQKTGPWNISSTPDSIYSIFASSTCPPPENWVYYFIQPDDDIFLLLRNNKVTIDQLLKANCLNDISELVPGLMIYIPVFDDIVVIKSQGVTQTNTATITPTPSPSHSVTSTSTSTLNVSDKKIPTIIIKPPTTLPSYTNTPRLKITQTTPPPERPSATVPTPGNR